MKSNQEKWTCAK